MVSHQQYKETEDYEKGFASYYLKNIVPILDEVQSDHSETKLRTNLRNVIIVLGIVILSLGALLFVEFDVLENRTVVAIITDLTELPDFSILWVLFFGLFVVSALYNFAKRFVMSPTHENRISAKALVMPKILNFFGPIGYNSSGGISGTSFIASQLYQMAGVPEQDLVFGNYKGRKFEFVKVEETSEHPNYFDPVEFREMILWVETPPTTGVTTLIERDVDGRWIDDLLSIFPGRDEVEHQNQKIAEKFKIYASDVNVPDVLLGEEMIGIFTPFTDLLFANKITISFCKSMMVCKFVTPEFLFESSFQDGNAFSVNEIKKIVNEVYLLLRVIDSMVAIIDKMEPRFKALIPPTYPNKIFKNRDGSFSIHGRTYKEYASAKAYLEHYVLKK